MVNCKHYEFVDIAALEYQSGLEGKVATHHMKLFHLTYAMVKPLVVEFGVNKGYSTCVFLNACEHNGGHLYSVDVHDFSDSANSDVWTFIQQSDLERDSILAKVPAIADGIDHLHIDSYHSGQHVQALLMIWFPYVKPGGYITFHDVDPHLYGQGQRKDSPLSERLITEISDVIKKFFYANEDQLFLEFHFGSTGMGIMKKLSPLGALPVPPSALPRRRIYVLHRQFERLKNRLQRV